MGKALDCVQLTTTPACLYGKAADNSLLNNSTPLMFSFVLTFDYSWKLFDMLWRCWSNEAVFCAFRVVI